MGPWVRHLRPWVSRDGEGTQGSTGRRGSLGRSGCGKERGGQKVSLPAPSPSARLPPPGPPTSDRRERRLKETQLPSEAGEAVTGQPAELPPPRRHTRGHPRPLRALRLCRSSPPPQGPCPPPPVPLGSPGAAEAQGLVYSAVAVRLGDGVVQIFPCWYPC